MKQGALLDICTKFFGNSNDHNVTGHMVIDCWVNTYDATSLFTTFTDYMSDYLQNSTTQNELTRPL